MKLRPLSDFVLIRREKPEEVSKGGILLAPTAQAKSRTGEVLAVGPGRYLENGTRLPVDVEPGQVVYFRGTVGQEVRIDDEDLVLVRDSEIDGVVER